MQLILLLMKQTVTIFLLLLYFSSASGMVINVHYCGKQVEKVSILNFTHSKGCDCNPGNGPMDCCRNYTLYNKADSHKNFQVVALPEIPALAVSPSLFQGFIFTIPQANLAPIAISDILRSCSQPVYLLNRVFRI